MHVPNERPLTFEQEPHPIPLPEPQSDNVWSEAKALRQAVATDSNLARQPPELVSSSRKNLM